MAASSSSAARALGEERRQPGRSRTAKRERGDDNPTQQPVEEGVCLACNWRVKQKHTYGGQCAKYVPGATLEQMKRAAQGGLRDKRRLLMTLRLQCQDAQQQETITSSSTSSPPSSTTRKRKQAKGQQEKPQETAIVGKRIGENNAPPLPRTGEAIVEEERNPDMIEQILRWGEGQKKEAKVHEKTIGPEEGGREACEEGSQPRGGQRNAGKFADQEKRESRVPPPESARVDESKIDERERREQRVEWTRNSCAKNQQSREHGKSDSAERSDDGWCREAPASPIRVREDTPVDEEDDLWNV